MNFDSYSQTVSDLNQRLQLLEKRANRQRMLTIAIFVCLLLQTIIFTALAPINYAKADTPKHDVPDLLRARRLEIIDKDGKRRISIGTNSKGKSEIVLLDQEGNVQWKAPREYAATPFAGRTPPAHDPEKPQFRMYLLDKNK